MLDQRSRHNSKMLKIKAKKMKISVYSDISIASSLYASRKE